MTSELDMFEFDGHRVRIATINDAPWFVASDVAHLLGFRDAYGLVRGLDPDERGTHGVGTPGGPQQMTVVSESGLYTAIIRSRVAEARPFKQWVTREVLPTLRRTGVYRTPGYTTRTEEPHPLPRSYAAALRELASTVEERDQARTLAAELEAPAAAWNTLADDAAGDYTISDAAKILARDGIETGPRKLFDWMAGERWIFRRGGAWHAMQARVNAGLLVERVQHFRDPTTAETRTGDPQVRVTIRGLERLHTDLTAEQKPRLVVLNEDTA